MGMEEGGIAVGKILPRRWQRWETLSSGLGRGVYVSPPSLAAVRCPCPKNAAAPRGTKPSPLAV